MTKLVLVDGNAILHRAFHALPPLTNQKGQQTNAVYGLVSMLLKVIVDLKPTHIAVSFDLPKPTFRNKMYEDYQAQRPHMADELSSQFKFAKEVINAFGIPIYEKEGFEADDVIGTIAKQSKENVIVVTGDRDMLQLVDEKTKLYMPVAGMSQAKLMGKDETFQKMGVEPEQIADYKGLVGDPSDNYPGVAGIGPKTAEKLLEEYGSFENIYKNLDKIPQNISKKLRQDKQKAELSYKLATIVRDAPVKLNLEACSKWDIDSPNVLKVFKSLGFKTLTDRVKKLQKQMDEEKQGSLFE